MKHKGIICFVYQKEREEIFQAIGIKTPIIFSEDFDDINKNKPEHYYIVISLKMADKNFNNLRQILNKYPNNDYPILHDNDDKFSDKVLDIFWEVKIPYHNHTTSSIIRNIIKMVDN